MLFQWVVLWTSHYTYFFKTHTHKHTHTHTHTYTIKTSIKQALKHAHNQITSKMKMLIIKDRFLNPKCKSFNRLLRRIKMKHKLKVEKASKQKPII